MSVSSPPPAPIDWVKLISMLVAALMTGFVAHPIVNPAPSAPPAVVTTNKATIVITDASGGKYTGKLADGVTFTINVNTGVMTLFPAATPPPAPPQNHPPTPVVTPPPPPTPVAGPLTVVLVYDKLDGITGQLLQDIAGINEMKRRGHTWKPLLAGPNGTAVQDPFGQKTIAAATSKKLTGGSYFALFKEGSLILVDTPPAPTTLLSLIQANGGT